MTKLLPKISLNINIHNLSDKILNIKMYIGNISAIGTKYVFYFVV